MDRPILFKDGMVRAILSGQKTQTRRVMKRIDHDLLNMMSEDLETEAPNSELLELLYGPSTDDDGKRVPDQWLVRCTECPEEGVLTLGQGYGKIGDRLWVREAFQGPLVPYDRADEFFGNREKFEHTDFCEYRADGGPAPVFVDMDDEERQGWRPSIHMPRWASRITLEITDVRVERLQDISEKDACAEGADQAEHLDAPEGSYSFTEGFRRLWQSINGPDSWSANPWVWVIEFRRGD